MKVRIGNDIRLNLTLKGNFDKANIKQLRCYLINTSIMDYNPFLCECSRFPHHCCGHCLHHPINGLCMHTCGTPCYHVDPCNAHCCCCGHEKYPQTPCNPAHGEGPLRPNYGHCDCLCDGMRCCEMHHDHHNYCRYGHRDCRANCHCGFCMAGNCCDVHPHCPEYFRPGYNDFIAPHLDENFRYIASSKVLPGQNRIQTFFPARDQFMCGDYKLIVVVVKYESGWGRCDLHSYTIDYGTVVTLVDDPSGMSGNITIDVDTDTLEDAKIDGIMLNNTHLTMKERSQLELGSYDIYNKLYQIQVTLRNASTVVYVPEDWENNGFEKLIFTPVGENADVITIDDNGKIASFTTTETKDVTVRVQSQDGTGAIAQFVVTVLAGGDHDYIGFSKATTAANLEFSQLAMVDNIFVTHNLTNIEEGAYLWICSRVPVKDADSADLNNVFYLRSNTFDAPMIAQPEIKEGYYCYRSQNALHPASFDITVEDK